MRFTFSLVCVGVLSMPLVGCVATTDEMRGIYARQTRLEARVERIYQDVESLKKQSETSGGNEEELMRLEESVEGLKRSYSELSTRLNSVENRVSAGLSSSSQSAVSPGLGGTTLESEARIYNQGYRDLTEGNYEQARKEFKQFMASYPKSAQAPDAQYWIAESYYREGKFEESILEFQRFIDAYPKDSKVPLSYLKQGLSLINIGRNEEAKLFLQTLIDKYPRSEEASIAREKLRELAVKR